MRRLFSFSVGFLFLLPLNAQNKFGIKSGISFSDRNGTNSNSTDLITLQVAAFGMIPLSKVVTMQPSFGYAPKGNKFRNLMFVDQLGGNNGYGDVNTRVDNIELAVPFQYLVTSSKQNKLLFGLGAFFSYAVGGMVQWKNVTGPGSNNPPPKTKINFDGAGLKRFDAGVNILITFQVKTRWVLSFNFDRGLINNNQSSYTQQTKLYSRSEGITAGYLFK